MPPYSSTSSAVMRSRQKPQNFYRFIHSDDVNQVIIRIPNKFIREHRKNILLNNVLITVSDEKIWSLGWMISGDGKLWLQKGWPEFAEHYCLKTGYLLIFNYLRKSVFRVCIFDRNSCEINYAPSNFLEIQEPATQDDESIAMSETEALDTPTIVQEIKASGKGNEYRRRKRAPGSAKSFKSDYPFYSVKIKASYVNWGLYIPLPFVRRYLLCGDEKCVDCALQLPDGRLWSPVKCRDYNNYGKLYGGNWNRFRDENHVGVGDVCVVELINEMEKVLKVTIFRAC
ncbi:hypothetical protein LXL04_024275 [Taraxacum kok-saghyz]